MKNLPASLCFFSHHLPASASSPDLTGRTSGKGTLFRRGPEHKPVFYLHEAKDGNARLMDFCGVVVGFGDAACICDHDDEPNTNY